MGQSSTRYEKEQPYVPVVDVAIRDGDIQRLWSYNSTSGGRYVYLTNTNVPGDQGSFKVAATGEADGQDRPFTDITFEQTQPAPRMFRLKFNKNNSPYFVQASEHNVTASQDNSKATSFEVMELSTPNRPYIVLRSDKMKGNQDLYLSSNGAGKMSLKVVNTRRMPPGVSSAVDPAFFFRLVRISKEPGED